MRFADTMVHLVLDDPGRTQKFVNFLSSRGMNVATFRTAAEYVAGHDGRPACLILVVHLLDIEGLEMQRRLADGEAPPVIFVAAHCNPVSVVQAMKHGAIDVLIEPLDDHDLIAAVECAFIVDVKSRNQVIERTCLLSRWQSLTLREREVFHHTVAGLLNKQAAAELGITQNTYQVHRGRVMKKMKADSFADLVRMAAILEPIVWRPRHDEPVAPRWSLAEAADIDRPAFA